MTGGVETAEELSLSLFYRECQKDRLYPKKDEKLRTLETLDLIVPSSQQYKELLNALQDLLAMQKLVRSNTDRTTLLLEYLWIDSGKELRDILSNAEWLDLCERLNVPHKRSLLSSLFKTVQKRMNAQRLIGGGLPLSAIAELLNDVRFNYLDESGPKPPHHDPLLRLWNEILTTDPVPAFKSGEPADASKTQDPMELMQSISSVAFLSFIRTKQKEFKTTLDEANAKIHVLNGQTQQEKRLSKSQFLQYLFSDANDILDPERGRVGSDDMTHPLSHYWICSSHDTYLSYWNKKMEYDEYMYLAALYRGVRCLELDVWDRGNEPVIAREEPKNLEDPYLPLDGVLKVLRQFLLANPKCFPVILNLENHCSFKNQERLANELFRILGKSGLIVVPDDTASIDEADLLPSPHAMRGKVLIMGKRPKVIEEGAKVINDDFDDENDEYDPDELPTVLSREEEEAELDQGIVIGFDSAGPIKAKKSTEKNIVQHSTGELLYMAKQDLENAKMAAAQAELKALNLAEEADRAEKVADELIEQAGLAKDTILELAGHARCLEVDTEHVAFLARAQGEGVEVQEFFAGGVEASRLTYQEAEQEAIDAALEATEALQKLNEVTAKLREAEELLEASYKKERAQVADYQRAAAEARSRREDAAYAHKRVEKVRKLLEECEESANSAENVVVTAMTEAKISEKRAAETEARAARAAQKAQADRQKAEEETKKEEALEKEASTLHEQLSSASDRSTEARKVKDNIVSSIEKVTEQIKLIENSTQYKRELKEQESGIAEEKKDNGGGVKTLVKLAAKVDEKRLLNMKLKKAQSDLAEYQKKEQGLKESFEKTAHMWKSQTDVASKIRKTADKSARTAEELAEHAEEEREAANLRHAAREKAKSNVSEKDAYRQSLQAQLNEAERAAKDLEMKAQQARSTADALEPINEDLPVHDKNIRLVDRRKTVRDRCLKDYHNKKIIKDATEERATEAKRLFETSDNVYSQAMRNAAKEDRKADVQRQVDRNALLAFNQARLLRSQAVHALEDVRYAQSTVVERQMIIKRATEYNEKMARITPIPTSLAKMTFLHSTKHRHWDKSFDLPNTHVHSFAQGVLDEMKARDPQNPDRLKEFTTEHICRTFPSWKDMTGCDKINSEPLFLWALGCQLVALNYGTFDEHILKADGRFRRNGSCGYVLKPEHLTHDDPLRERKETWCIDVLGGSCLPSPETMKKTSINPYVKVVVYDGDIEGKKVEHRTKVVMKNGINPIWDEKSGITFTSINPSLSICVFTVWHKGEHGEEYIAGAALPLSSMREGFRSVALFDAYHTRSGPHSYASLLVKVVMERN